MLMRAACTCLRRLPGRRAPLSLGRHLYPLTIRHNSRHRPRLHEYLEYHHNVRQGKVKPPADYWEKVEVEYGAGFVPYKLKPGRDRRWNVPLGVVISLRINLKRTYGALGEKYGLEGNPTRDMFQGHLDSCSSVEDVKAFERKIASKVHKFHPADLASLIDALHQKHYEADALLSSTLRHLSNHVDLETLSIPTVLHIVFLVGVARNAPQELMRRIEAYVLARADQMDMIMFSVCGFGFNVSNTPFTSYALMQKMCDIYIRDLSTKRVFQSADMELVCIVNLMKSLSLSKFEDTDFYLKFADLIMDRVDHSRIFRVPTAMNLIRIYAAAGVRHVEFFNKLVEKIDIHKVHKEMKSAGRGEDQVGLLTGPQGMRIKDMTRLLWAFGTMDIPVEDIWLKTTSIFLNEESLVRLYPQSWLECLLSLAMFDISPVKLYYKFYEPSFLRRLLELAEEDRVDHYQILMLHQHIKSTFPEFEHINVLEEMFKDRRPETEKIRISLVVKVGLVEVWQELENLLGADCVTIQFAIKLSGIADLILHLDGNNVPVAQKFPLAENETEAREMFGYFRDHVKDAPNNHYRKSILAQIVTGVHEPNPTDLLESHCLRPDQINAKNRKICIRVLGYRQCFKNYPGILGYVKLENRILLKQGYEIYMMSPFDAHAMRHGEPETRTKFIMRMLQELNVNTAHVQTTRRPPKPQKPVKPRWDQEEEEQSGAFKDIFPV